MKLKVALVGSRSNRTPLAYEPYRRLFEKSFEYVMPSEADILVFAMSFEVKEFFTANPDQLSRLTEQSVWLISEEPLWDTVWNYENHTKETYNLVIDNVTIQINQISHFVNSPYKDLDFPYFLTTEDSFFKYYLLFFNNRLKAKKLPHYKKFGVGLLEFMNNYSRPEIINSYGDLIGLAGYRVRLAQYLRHLGMFHVAGQGWAGKKYFPQSKRQQAVDFHLQKLTALESQFGFMLAIENTLQKNYVSEKIFDAFAVGSVPIYYANNDHDVFKYFNKDTFFNMVKEGSFEHLVNTINKLDEQTRLDMLYDGIMTCSSLFKDFTLVTRTRRQVVHSIVNCILEQVK